MNKEEGMNLMRSWKAVVAIVGVLVGVLVVTGCASSGDGLRYADQQESYDGLRKVEGTAMDSVWVRPDTDLSQYGKVMFEGSGIQYVPVKPLARSALAPMRSNEFPIPPEVRAKLLEVISDSFRDRLSQLQNYEITDKAGADVLMVKVGLLDLVSRVPPQSAGDSDVYLDEVGKATLMIEIKDSESGATIVRAVDRRAAGDGSGAVRSNTVRNWSEVQQLADFWGDLMREGIDGLQADLESL